MAKNADHVVVNAKANGRFECRHCGDTMDPGYPIPLDGLASFTNEYVEKHRDCEPREKGDVEEKTEFECDTCGDEGSIEGGNVCGSPSLGGCRDGMCGGCSAEIPCPDCQNPDAGEPDWDSMREAREETAALQAEDEVEWEAPE